VSLRQLRIAVRSQRIASLSLGPFDLARCAAGLGARVGADRFLTSSNILKGTPVVEADGRLSVSPTNDAHRCKERLVRARFASFGESGVSTRVPDANSKTTKQSGSAPSERIVSFDVGGRVCRPGVSAR